MSRTFTTDEGLEVEYTFYKDDGTYIDPPSVQIDIENASLDEVEQAFAGMTKEEMLGLVEDNPIGVSQWIHNLVYENEEE